MTCSPEASPSSPVEVSIVTPVRDGAQWIRGCCDDILAQDFPGRLEWSVFDDGSSDGTWAEVEEAGRRLRAAGVHFIASRSGSSTAKGVGLGKNAAVAQSSGEWLCFLDVDDRMAPGRVRLQWDAGRSAGPETLLGASFSREPPGSTARYTAWANGLSPRQLRSQAFTSHGPTLVAPTWFMRRSLYDLVGPFRQDVPRGFPEDLDWFYRLLRRPSAGLVRVEGGAEALVLYRHHGACASHSVTEATLAELRNAELERSVLPAWSSLAIWNAGKAGKALFRALSEESRAKVAAFIDVDEKKLRHGRVELYDAVERRVTASVAVLRPEDARPPALVAVKLHMTNGQLEERLQRLGWREGTDFYHLN